MAAKMSVLGLILSSYPYLRSAMVRFPLPISADTLELRYIYPTNLMQIEAPTPRSGCFRLPLNLLCSALGTVIGETIY